MKKWAKTDISSLSYGSLKFSGDAQYTRTNNWDLFLGPGGPIFRQGGPKIEKSKKFKPYQVDTFRKGKIERNTIKQLSDRLEALTKSYSRFWQIFTQNGPILLIFVNFSRGKIKRFSIFWFYYICHILNLICANFGNISIKLSAPKIQKTSIFGLFLGQKTVFCNFLRGNSA